MVFLYKNLFGSDSRSRKGAWIEIHGLKTTFDSGYCRSRKGAWIEICAYVARYVTKKVAPARERGLKFVK